MIFYKDNVPNLISSIRIILSPIFLIAFYLPVWFDGKCNYLSVILCWMCMILMDLSDFVDGKIARKYHIVSDFGKFFDPYTDLIARFTYFICFTGVGIMPVWAFAIILYREFTVSFLRIYMMNRGFVMAARMGGKIKEWFYAGAAIASLGLITVERIGNIQVDNKISLMVVKLLYCLCVMFSVVSWLDYVIFVNKKNKESVDKSRIKE